MPRHLWYAVVSAISIACGQAADVQPPNIVFILSDDQSWTDYSFMGHPAIKTPNLDKLAARSVVFTRGYVPTALCRPSIATIVTGLYAHQHKNYGGRPSPEIAPTKSPEFAELHERLVRHLDRLPTLPRLLSSHGYLTFQSGKWFEGSYERGGFTHGMSGGVGRVAGDDGLTIGREGLQPVYDFVDHALEAKRPFFLWYAPNMPHHPHDPPERILARYRDSVDSLEVAKYYAMCEWFDETCGDLMAYLDKKGLGPNTFIIYLSDNGWIQSPSGSDSEAAPRSKRSPYEGGVRQPIMLCWPRRIRPGVRCELVSSVDLLPTILSAADAQIPKGVPGVDLLPVATGAGVLARDTIFGEAFAHHYAADIEDPEAALMYRWAIEGSWKLILTYDGDAGPFPGGDPRTDRRPQLFHLGVDPHEERNLAESRPEIVERLAEKIAAWWSVTKRRVITRWAKDSSSRPD